MQGVNYPLCVASRAKVMGLVRRDDLNGKVVKLEALEASGRWRVVCEKTQESLLIKPENLHAFSDIEGYGTTVKSKPVHELPCNWYGTIGSHNKACAGCKASVYCSRECQTQHWPSHKGFCRQQRKNNKEPAQDLSAMDLYHQGLAKSHQGQNREAIEFYRASLAKDPFLFIAVANLAATLRRVGDNAEALVILQDAARRLPDAPASAIAAEPRAVLVVHETLGNAYLSNYDVPRAMAAYRQAMGVAEELHLRLGLVEPGPYIQMAQCYDLLGERAASLNLKRQNAARFPEMYLCHYNLGCELRVQHPMEFGEAARCFRAARALPDGKRDADVHAMLGTTLLDEAVVRRSDVAEAIACFEAALKRDRHHPAAQRNLHKAKAYGANPAYLVAA